MLRWVRRRGQQGVIRIEDDTSNANGPDRDVVSPVAQHQADGGNFEWNQKSFVDEEVPADHEA